MRTLDECYNEIKKIDENTAISKYYIRQLAISGKIPVVMCGRKRLINLDGLINYLSCSGDTTETATEYTPSNNIRPIY
uniref:DNA-binding protein n=1 Tax=uncultured Ruminococcus sp. TaxID=165186 RepID=UPI0025F587C1|nr:DNA-binding protein [uncultured Ruminococcus sp.]